ncbi:MAG: IPT/TIG domain-containing protein [Acidobacteriia bacterium]|nr:IPT/TIG domain-containing protein [Terriglobia bacterium]
MHTRPVRSVLFFASAVAWSQPYVISTIAGGVGPITPVAGLSASVSPTAVTVDRLGNIYFSSRQSVFLLDVKGTLTRVAGTSRAGFSGDGGPAVNAQLNNPKGLALDGAGNLYIADTNNWRVRRVSTAGVITTIAGIGNEYGGYPNWGDGGPAVKAQLFGPVGVAFDSADNLYIAEGMSVRKVSPEGTIRTVAGGGIGRYGDGDGGPATQAVVNPIAIAVDSNHIYIAEYAWVRQVSPEGIISTVAGTHSQGAYTGEGGPATKAAFFNIEGLSLDEKGNLYIADTGHFRLFRVATDGTISTVAGNGNQSDSGDGGGATSAGLGGPIGVAVDASGNMFLSELSNRIRKITPGGTITTVAGNGAEAYSGDGGSASTAQLNSPWGIAVDARGNLFISDSGNHTVRKVAPDGTISTVAGTGLAGFSGDGGAATGAQLNTPLGIALDSAGNLYVADCRNQRVRRVSASGSITTIAGNGMPGYAGDGGPATQAGLSCPHGVAVDSDGSLYIGDTENNRVRRVGPDGVISTNAGTGAQGFGGDGGPAAKAQLYAPTSLALDASGNLFIADTGNSMIRKVTRDGAISTVAGEVPPPGFYADPGDGRLSTQTTLSAPQGLAVDSAGNLYIGETQGNHIRRVSASGIVSTIAGSGLYGPISLYDNLADPAEHGYTGDGAPATSAKLNVPFGVAVDSSSNIYFADMANSAVRLLQPGPIASAASILAGPIAPGELVTLYGSGLGPSQLTTSTPDLAGTQVLFNGVPAPVIYSSATQVAAVAPDSLIGTSVKVEVRYQGESASAFTASVAPSAPALFAADATGKGLAAAINQDGSYNTTTNSAGIGSTISLFVTGAGAPPIQPVSVTIGGESAEVQHVGLVDRATGVLRIDVQVPSNVLANVHFLIGFDINVPVPLSVQIGNAVSQPGIYVTVNYCSAGCTIGDVLHRPRFRGKSLRPPVLSARNVKLKMNPEGQRF